MEQCYVQLLLSDGSSCELAPVSDRSGYDIQCGLKTVCTQYKPYSPWFMTEANEHGAVTVILSETTNNEDETVLILWQVAFYACTNVNKIIASTVQHTNFDFLRPKAGCDLNADDVNSRFGVDDFI